MGKSIEGKPILMIEVDGTIYPVAMTESQYNMFTMLVGAISPITIVKDRPQGKAVNLLDKKKPDVH